MAGDKRLYLYWDPAIDGAFRRRLERALGGLKVNASDGDTVDPDPESPGVAMALASQAGGWAAPNADIVVRQGREIFRPQPAHCGWRQATSMAKRSAGRGWWNGCARS